MDPDPGNYTYIIFLLQTSGIFTISQLLFFCLLICCSFLVSGAEVAFFSLSKAEIEEFRNHSSKFSQRVWKLLSHPQQLLATILISNNFLNVVAILIGTSILHTLLTSKELTIWEINLGAEIYQIDLEFIFNIVIITSIILFFGEIVPKVFASKHRMPLIRITTIPLEFLGRLFQPLIWMLLRFTKFIDTRIELQEESASIQDLKHALEITTTNDDNREEKEILRGIVNFGSIPVKSVMRARVDVIAVDIQTSLGELVDVVKKYNYSRLPIYEESLDNVKGILHIKDLLPYLRKENQEVALQQLLRAVHFVPESKKIDDLLEEFKRRRLHMAVVVDEYGGTAGIVTLEDIIEEIFGEIHDEFDSEDWVYTKIDDDTYIFEGRISLNDVRKIVGLHDDIFEDAKGDSDSLGGLILELYGKIPNPGEIITYQHIKLQVEAVSETRITMIKFIINKEVEETAK